MMKAGCALALLLLAVSCAAGASITYVQKTSSLTNGTILVVKASSQPNQLYVFSTIGFPSLAVLHGQSPLSLPDVQQWNTQDIEGLKFSANTLPGLTDSVTLAATMVLENMVIFDDSDSKARIRPESIVLIEDFAHMVWLAPTIDTTSGAITLTSANSRLTFVIKIRGSNGEDSLLPHMLYGPGSFTLSVTINTIQYPFPVEDSKIGVSWRFVSSDNQLSFKETKTINDERAPSIFIYNTVAFGASQAYMQWNPSFYGDTKRGMANASIIHYYGLEARDWVNMTESVAASLSPTATSQFSYFSFGTDHDKTWTPQLTSWSMVIGVGSPRSPEFSPALLWTIIITTSLPGVGFVAGGLYRCIRNRRRGASGYLAIQ